MLDIVDFLEPIIQGNWKYFGGFVLGVLFLILIRYIRLLWVERQILKMMNLYSRTKTFL